MKTKKFFAEQIINELQNDYPNIDLKLDERDGNIILSDAVL